MKRNSFQADTGSASESMEIYENDILYFVDEYIERELDGNTADIKSRFKDMINYVSRNISIPHEDFTEENLYRLFSTLCRICDRYNYNPSIGLFYKLIKSNNNLIKDILKNRFNLFLSNINNICKDYIIDYLSNNAGSSKNMIFIASAVYGMSETAPTRSGNELEKLTNKEIAEQIGLIEKKPGSE